jgi:hypothetical protein
MNIIYFMGHSTICPYKGPYQGQEHLSEEIINKLPKEPFPLAVMLIRQLVASSPSLGTIEKPTFHPRELAGENTIFQLEKQAFNRLKPELLSEHRGQYVVIREEKAVMFGDDKTELAMQAYRQFGYGPLYIGLVEEGPEVTHIPTPRVHGV